MTHQLKCQGCMNVIKTSYLCLFSPQVTVAASEVEALLHMTRSEMFMKEEDQIRTWGRLQLILL